MGSDDQAVVESKLCVRGLDGIRVADASNTPTMVTSKTNAPAILIGERCADLFMADAA